MSLVKAKKHLGQHFLTDESIAQQIADSLVGSNYKKVLEIGPGMGVLTKYLLEKRPDFKIMGNFLLHKIKPLVPYFKGDIECHNCHKKSNIFDGIMNSI